MNDNPCKSRVSVANHSHFDTNATLCRECCIFGELVQHFLELISHQPAALYIYSQIKPVTYDKVPGSIYSLLLIIRHSDILLADGWFPPQGSVKEKMPNSYQIKKRRDSARKSKVPLAFIQL